MLYLNSLPSLLPSSTLPLLPSAPPPHPSLLPPHLPYPSFINSLLPLFNLDVNLEEENITEEGYAFYRFLRDGALAPVPIPHICVYLDAAAQLCEDRVNSRNRGCESGIPVAYLEKLGKVSVGISVSRCASMTLLLSVTLSRRLAVSLSHAPGIPFIYYVFF